MKFQTKCRFEKVLLQVFIAVALILSSYGCFLSYLYKYLAISEETRSKIYQLLSDMSIYQDKYLRIIFIIGCITMTIMWFLGFVMYKFIFKITKVKNVLESELLIALGSAYTISFLLASLLVGRIGFSTIIVITNIIESAVVFFGISEKINKKMCWCILCRTIVLGLNVMVQLINNY